MQTDVQPQQRDVFLSSPQTGILHSSELLGWGGIVLKQSYLAAGEYTFPRLSSHLICLHQGTPTLVEHIHDKQSLTNIMSRGSLQIVPAGTENTWRHDSGVQLLHLYLAPALLQQVAEDYHQHHVELLTHFKPQDRRVEYISSALLLEVLEGGTTGRLYVEGLATALAAHLVQTYTSTPRPHPQKNKQLPAFLFRRITSLIEDRLDEDLSLTELASEANLSPSHFANLFRQTTGLSPHHYIVQRRLERAQHLLTSTKLSISEIATMVGFYDHSHLVRQMRRVMGVTPTYIREHLS
ncbi:helix-turn-helix domain-containing protein [Dictyobacter aurantiacus]|uniref:AraC family transcriptional regulator n=1 Tax=Dictyobacter aurantiacus TaxID=1936993 RepID=A0A401ZNV4_9CHLR|nr:AraC family transcriptional regulator [Dictyobacter aurantiacus]GCE08490.1 AraC family transcriptional regulator [Dictyobacter aurantiacus]